MPVLLADLVDLELSHVLLLSDEHLPHLHGLKQLTSLKLIACELVTDEGVRVLPTSRRQ